MNFNFTEDQQLIRDSISKYLGQNYDFLQRQEIIKAGGDARGYSTKAWQETAELGWFALLLENLSGTEGYDDRPVNTIMLFEELGRHLVLEPYMESLVLFAGALVSFDDDYCNSVVADVVAGNSTGVLAHIEGSHGNPLVPLHSTAVKSGAEYQLSGNKVAVYHAGGADYILLTAMTDDGLGLFLLGTNHLEAMRREDFVTIDGKRASNLFFDKLVVPASSLLCAGDEVQEMVERVFLLADLALAAEMQGAMEALLDMTVEYCNQRKQFGTAIANFQSLQHMIADMFVAIELSRSLIYAAACKLAEQEDDAPRFVTAAKARADQSAVLVAEHAVQLHGGIGTTDELAVSHYLKRITVATHCFGSTRQKINAFEQMKK